METSMAVVWWFGLVGAVLITLLLLKVVAVIFRNLRHIHRLAVHVRRASRGLGDTLVGDELAGLAEPARRLTVSLAELEAVARRVEQRARDLAGEEVAG
jgi:hypothetical protein